VPQKAFGYVRLSKMDEGTTSPQRQRAEIRKWCRAHDVRLVHTFEDLDLSAYRKGVRRHGFEQMLSRLGEVDVIVTWRLDRLVRSVSGFAKLVDRLEEARIVLVTTDGAVDMTTASGRAFAQMRSVFAELEAGTTSERSRQMHAFKREHGEWVGRVPMGFRRVGKRLEVDPEEFGLLEDVARRYVSGESLRAIAATVGVRHTTLARSLRTDRVIDHLPPALGRRLVEQMADRGRTGTRAVKSLLGGAARCGVCGAGMTVVAQSVRGGRRLRGAYGCRERGHVYISRPWLDAFVTECVLDAIDTGRLVAAIEKRTKRRPGTPVAKDLEARLEILERDYYERALLDRDRYLRRREGLIKKLADAQRRDEPNDVDLPRELAENLVERWPMLDVVVQRQIVRAVVREIVVDRANGHGRIDPARVLVRWRI
jgi:DNA invertase Pin-like site-specific DNA recombinase